MSFISTSAKIASPTRTGDSMAKTKQTIARFIDEYGTYLSSIQNSIARVEKEREQWVKEQKAMEETWAGTPVVANLAAAHSHEAWWAALEKTTDPTLHDIRKEAERKVASLVQNQQFSKDKIEECTLLSQSMMVKLADADSVMAEAHAKKQEADAQLEKALRARNEFQDSFIDGLINKWESQPAASRSPMNYDYSAPQPWWAKPWLLAITNSEMAANMLDAARFEQKTGKNLYAAAQGYEQRRVTLQEAQDVANTANRDYKKFEVVYNSLVDAKQSNDKELQRSIDWILPDYGPKSLAAQSQHMRTSAVEKAAKYCIVNNVAQVGGLSLVLPNAEEYARLAGKLAAMKKVTDSLDTATNNWKKGEIGVEGALDQLNKLARKHNRSTKVSIDTDPAQNMARGIEQASINTHDRFKSARPLMRQNTPFAPQPLPVNTNTVVPTHTASNSSTNTNDSTFWMMAWMYLMMSPGPASAIENGSRDMAPTDGAALPLLDPVKFEHDFQNANGGLGLASDISLGSLAIADPQIFVDSARGWASDSSAGFSVSIPDVQIDTSSISTSSSGSSWSSSESSSYSSSSSSDSGSSGSSCGGGGGD